MSNNGIKRNLYTVADISDDWARPIFGDMADFNSDF